MLSFVTRPAPTSSRSASRRLRDVREVDASSSSKKEAPSFSSDASVRWAGSLSGWIESVAIQARAVPRRTNRIVERSEERRVGKECRSGWWAEDEKKKK